MNPEPLLGSRSGECSVTQGGDSLHSPTLLEGWQIFAARYEWSWFVTQTFRDTRRGTLIHPESADKMFRLWVSMMNRSLLGPRWAKKAGRGLRWMRASEPQRRGAIHFHSLMGGEGIETLRRLDWMDRWWDLCGTCRIEPPAHAAAVELYVAKYVTKGGQVDVSDNLRAVFTGNLIA